MEERNNTQYTQAIWEITQTLQNAKTLREALTTALRQAGRAIKVEEGTVWYFNKRDSRIYPISTLGDGTSLAGLTLAAGEGIAGDVIQTGNPTFVRDCATDPRFARRFDKESGFVTRSMICMPIRSRGAVIGCIQLINKQNGMLFNRDDADLCENLAYLVGMAIEAAGFMVNLRPQTAQVASLRRVTKEYGARDQRVRMLRGVNLDVYAHELLVIHGESGCGKKTLLDILGGLETPTTGVFLVGERDLSRADEKALAAYRRESVGFVFQTGNLLPSLTLEENLRMAARLGAKPADIPGALELAGFEPGQGGLYPQEMTAGQRQRASMARAIVKSPLLILAYDPVAELDFFAAREALVALGRMVRQGATVVMITHNAEIAKMANRVVRMQNGAIVDSTGNGNPVSADALEW